jgi:hypothetical protein
MKIIASSKISYFMEGILLVLTKLGNDCIVWDDKIKPFFNMLDEQKPDILFLTPSEQKYLNVGLNGKNIKMVFVGKGEPTTKPDLWIEPIPYANTIKYSSYKEYYNSGYRYDLVYFSDFQINQRQFNELAKISKINDIKLGVFGKIRLPLYEYCGIDLRNERALLINNCLGGIDFFGNLFLDFAYFNKFCLTFFDNPIYFTVKEFDEEILGDIKNKVNDRKEYILDNKLTDCHITSAIINKLGYEELSNKCLQLLNLSV